MNLGRILAAVAGAFGAGGAAALTYFALADETSDDDETGETLPPSAAPVVHQVEARTLGTRAVENLAYWIGDKGKGPKGSPDYHRSPFIDRIMRGYHNDAGDKLLGKAWCARAVRFAFEEAAAELSMPRPFSPKLGTLAMAESWKKSPFDKFRLSSAKVGAVWVIKTSVGYHAGLVAKVLGPLSVVTVEGNHSDSVASVKRTFNLDKDVLVDVEAWIASQATFSVVGFDDFGV